MKKFLAVFAAAVLAAGVTAASAQVYDQPLLGLSIDLPEAPANITFQPLVDEDDGGRGISVLFINADVMEPVLEAYEAALDSGDDAAQEKAAEDYSAAADANIETYATIIGVPTATLDAAKATYGITDEYTEMGVNGDYTYFKIKYDLPADTQLSEESKKLFEECKESGYAIADGMGLIPIEEKEPASAIGSFTTVDMDGNTVDASIFANADLTIVNLWATNCNPCIGELPELAAWAKTLPENVQIIGLITDVQDPSDKTFGRAQKIIAKAGIGYTNIIMNDSLKDFVSSITGTPTTFFLGKDGNAVHDPIVGAYPDQYKQAVEEFLAK